MFVSLALALSGAPPALAETGPEYAYNPIGKRDPFRTPFVQVPPPVDGLSPWDVDQYVLTGVVWEGDAPRALLMDPEHGSHVVEPGTYVGRNWGKVTAITSEGVIVTEEYMDIQGNLVTHKIEIPLRPEDD
ncbi:MAG: pilus assembly protein PilP [Alphaproteobacteria bacterium]|nr:pilus assembly protein PilP [Alphaproteobacteria bacterium]